MRETNINHATGGMVPSNESILKLGIGSVMVGVCVHKASAATPRTAKEHDACSTLCSGHHPDTQAPKRQNPPLESRILAKFQGFSLTLFIIATFLLLVLFYCCYDPGLNPPAGRYSLLS